MHYADTHTPVPIMGASCLVFSLLVLPLSCLWVHTVSIASRRAEEVDTDESEDRRPILSGGKKKVEPPALLSLSHFLSLSLSLSLALWVSRQSWNGSPQHRTASLIITTAALTQLFQIQVSALRLLLTGRFESHFVFQKVRYKSVWFHLTSKSQIKISVVSRRWDDDDDSVWGRPCDCGHVVTVMPVVLSASPWRLYCVQLMTFGFAVGKHSCCMKGLTTAEFHLISAILSKIRRMYNI